MDFIIKQSKLAAELAYVASVVEKKSTIPVLSHVLIESLGEHAIRITGTDLDITLRCDAEAEIIKPGFICVQAARLNDIVRLLEEGDIYFTSEENHWVKVKAGRSNFRLAGVDKEQFPTVVTPHQPLTPLPAHAIADMIQHTAFAITNEQSRFTLGGAKFVIDNHIARMVTTDGHRLAFIEAPLDASLEFAPLDVLVPKKGLLALLRAARDAETVSVGEDKNHIFFETEGRLVVSRKLSGNFPNYEMVMPKDNDKESILDLEALRAAVKRVSLMADERTKGIRLTVRSGELEITAQSSEEGSGAEIVAAEYEGEETTFGFNSQYLQEFLNAVSGGPIGAEGGDEKESEVRISIAFKDANAQTLLTVAGETKYEFLYIVMPLRI